MGRPQVRPGLVVAVRVASQVLCVAAPELCGEVFVRFGPEAGGTGVVHGSGDGELHAKVQGLGRAVAAPRRVAAAARRAPGVLVRAVRVVRSTASPRLVHATAPLDGVAVGPSRGCILLFCNYLIYLFALLS